MADRPFGFDGPSAGLKKLELDPSIPPWEMQPDESVKMYDRFCFFRDLGSKRQIKNIVDVYARREREERGYDDAEAARRYKCIRAHFQQVATRFRWWERARAFDAEIDRQKTQERIDAERDAVRQATEAHSQLSQGLVILGGKALTRFLDPDGKLTNTKIDGLTFGELAAFVRAAIGTDRLTKGIDAAESRETAPAPPGPGNAMSFEDMKKVARAALAEQAAKPREDGADDPIIVPPPRPDPPPSLGTADRE